MAGQFWHYYADGTQLHLGSVRGQALDRPSTPWSLRAHYESLRADEEATAIPASFPRLQPYQHRQGVKREGVSVYGVYSFYSFSAGLPQPASAKPQPLSVYREHCANGTATLGHVVGRSGWKISGFAMKEHISRYWSRLRGNGSRGKFRADQASPGMGGSCHVYLLLINSLC